MALTYTVYWKAALLPSRILYLKNNKARGKYRQMSIKALNWFVVSFGVYLSDWVAWRLWGNVFILIKEEFLWFVTRDHWNLSTGGAEGSLTPSKAFVWPNPVAQSWINQTKQVLWMKTFCVLAVCSGSHLPECLILKRAICMPLGEALPYAKVLSLHLFVPSDLIELFLFFSHKAKCEYSHWFEFHILCFEEDLKKKITWLPFLPINLPDIFCGWRVGGDAFWKYFLGNILLLSGQVLKAGNSWHIWTIVLCSDVGEVNFFFP